MSDKARPATKMRESEETMARESATDRRALSLKTA
jgi:hypothetical protein